MSGPLTEDQQQYIQMIKKVCGEGNSLIKDLLEIRSIEDKQPEETTMSVVNISAYLDVFVSQHVPLGEEKNIKILLEKDLDDSVNLMTNAEYLTRSLDNLVSKALKFSPRETTVCIKAETKDNQVYISISDQGPGLNELDQAILFIKFKRLTAKPTGGESSTGLGLSIVKTLVTRLNGKIIVESTVGKGTTFTVVFAALNLSYASQ
jgi:signal transduction histidine kinase